MLLALAVCLKPIALPVALVALIYLATRSWRATLRFALVLLAGVLVLYARPFFVLGWDPQPATHLWHKVWDMSGTLSYMTILRLARDPFLLPGGWWLLGLAWIPALAVAAVYLVRRGIGDVDDLLRACTALVLVFFLTRTWLSEPNVVLVLPFALLLDAARPARPARLARALGDPAAVHRSGLDAAAAALGRLSRHDGGDVARRGAVSARRAVAARGAGRRLAGPGLVDRGDVPATGAGADRRPGARTGGTS